MYYWQANPVSGGRDVKRQAISFPSSEHEDSEPLGAQRFMV